MWRLYVLSLMIVGGLAVLLLSLAYRQLAQGEYWTAQAAQGSTRVVKLPASRGIILDRTGKVVLVDNRPSYNVALFLDEFGAGRKEQKLLDKVQVSVKRLKERMKMPVHVNDQIVRVHYKLRGPLPLTVWNDLSPAAMAAFEERYPWMPGVDRDVTPGRVYPFGTLASHILGYVGKPENEEDESEMDFDSAGRNAFSQPSVVGKAGIEAAMDRELQGMSGRRVIRLNAAGLKEAQIQDMPPTPRNRGVFSIDREIQTIVEEAFTGYRGACVVMDPRNGEVLAMASVPDFNPNLFVPAIRKADWQALQKNAEHPLMNRAIQADYEPGSSFKVIASLAGLEGGINPKKTTECLGTFYLGDKPFKCWSTGGHGDMNMREAITMSCNVYFYTLGSRIGGAKIAEMADAFGLGKITGIPMEHESPGILPTEAWKRKKNPRDRWTTGDSVNMAIGQGSLGVTPLQMAVVAATLANGGTVFQPRLVLRVETPRGNTVTDFPPAIRGHIPATPEHIQFVREAMLNVVENGTGKKAAVDKVQVAAKTGSAQHMGRDPATREWIKQTRAWMIAFAPFNEPRYAIALVAEGGESGGNTAAPFVGKIFKRLFQFEQGHKTPPPPAAVAAIPVNEKIEGLEGEVSGELMDENTRISIPKTNTEEDPSDAPPPSFPAEKVNIP